MLLVTIKLFGIYNPEQEIGFVLYVKIIIFKTYFLKKRIHLFNLISL